MAPHYTVPQYQNGASGHDILQWLLNGANDHDMLQLPLDIVSVHFTEPLRPSRDISFSCRYVV